MGKRILCGYLLLHQHSEHRAVPSARHVYLAVLPSLVLLFLCQMTTNGKTASEVKKKKSSGV